MTTKIDTDATRYAPTFSRPAELDEQTADTLSQIEGGSPLTLDEVAWACATYRVSASLYAGDHTSARQVGSVDAHGNYTMT